jgi:hypothetical protein
MIFRMFSNPSPEGRGCREAAGEGCRNEKSIKEIPVVPLTRPAGAGHPLPSGEGFARKHFPMIAGEVELTKSTLYSRVMLIGEVKVEAIHVPAGAGGRYDS